MTRFAQARHTPVSAAKTAVDGGGGHYPAIDVKRLAETIFELEQSLHHQDLTLSPRDRAELIAEAYREAANSGEPPDPRNIDRMVWMKAG